MATKTRKPTSKTAAKAAPKKAAASKATAAKKTAKNSAPADETKRDFVVMAAGGVAAAGAACMAAPLVTSLAPGKDMLALATTEVDVSSLVPGEGKKVTWQGKTVFIRRRTQAEIDQARAVKLTDLPDQKNQPDDIERVLKGKDDWLVVIGICTHLGCIPLADKGDYDGWFCPCHGSHYDISGRIRKGPAPDNLVIPPYGFKDDNTIILGKTQEELDAKAA